MRLRFFQALGLLLLVALGAFAGVARALDFDDEDPQPPHGEVGAVYEYAIGSHAGCLPHRLEILSGQLPPGLSIRRIALDKHVVEGVPTEAGTFSAWIALRDCDNKSSEALFTFDIWARRWAITTQALKPAVSGAAYSQALQGSGPDSDVTWTITDGALPAGLTLATTGTISGTATAAGSATFTVKADAKEKNFGPERIDSRQYTRAAGGADLPFDGRGKDAISRAIGRHRRTKSVQLVGDRRSRRPHRQLRRGRERRT